MKSPRILIIAGSDSGGGAGIQADIKTVTMLGGFAMTAVTAITAQNTLGVDAVMPVSADMVLKQIDAVVRDIGVDAVKIGMIGSAETAEAVADYLENLPSFPRKRESRFSPSGAKEEQRDSRFRGNDEGRIPIVFDPVMVATSGAELADAATIGAFEKLMRLATLVTPNIPELAALSGREIGNIADAEAGAMALSRRCETAVLVKGGHLAGDCVTDILVESGKATHWQGDRIDTRHSHGTGCTLASAVATGLGAGMALADAIARAGEYVRTALVAAPEYGAGHGPMGHALGRAPFDDIHRK